MNRAMSNNQYEAREDLHTLKRHAEITADTKRHNAAKAMAKHDMSKLQKIVAPKAPSKPAGKRK